MVAHVGELESRLAEAVEELKTMRQELQQVQNRSLKAVLQKSCKSLENNISNMRQKLAELKDHIIEGCQKKLFRLSKSAALLPWMAFPGFFHVKPMLEGSGKRLITVFVLTITLFPRSRPFPLNIIRRAGI